MAQERRFFVFIVDDHPTFRAGLRVSLEEDPTLVVVGDAGNPESARARLRLDRVDLLTLDITMARGDSLGFIRDFKKDRPDLRILMITMHRDWSYVKLAAEAGADGYVLKDSDPEILRAAAREVLAGRTVFPPDVFASPAAEPPHEGLQLLSEREREVLRLVGRGLRNQEIAQELGLSVRTVETHRSNMLSKLGLRGAMDLVRLGAELNRPDARRSAGER